MYRHFHSFLLFCHEGLKSWPTGIIFLPSEKQFSVNSIKNFRQDLNHEQKTNSKTCLVPIACHKEVMAHGEIFVTERGLYHDLDEISKPGKCLCCGREDYPDLPQRQVFLASCICLPKWLGPNLPKPQERFSACFERQEMLKGHGVLSSLSDPQVKQLVTLVKSNLRYTTLDLCVQKLPLGLVHYSFTQTGYSEPL